MAVGVFAEKVVAAMVIAAIAREILRTAKVNYEEAVCEC